MEQQPAIVLVVEDDPVQSDLLRDILECDGYQVESAADGAAALGRIQAGDIDLVLLDISLPKLDGLAVCQRMQTPEHTTHPPIVLLTAVADDTLHQTGVAAGASGCITKPYDINELLAVVARHCP